MKRVILAFELLVLLMMACGFQNPFTPTPAATISSTEPTLVESAEPSNTTAPPVTISVTEIPVIVSSDKMLVFAEVLPMSVISTECPPGRVDQFSHTLISNDFGERTLEVRSKNDQLTWWEVISTPTDTFNTVTKGSGIGELVNFYIMDNVTGWTSISVGLCNGKLWTTEAHLGSPPYTVTGTLPGSNLVPCNGTFYSISGGPGGYPDAKCFDNENGAIFSFTDGSNVIIHPSGQITASGVVLHCQPYKDFQSVKTCGDYTITIRPF